MINEKEIDEVIESEINTEETMEEAVYTISFINGQPGLVVRGNVAGEMAEKINEILPVYKKFRDAVEKAQPKPETDNGPMKKVICNDCQSEMVYRSGYGKNGKWEAYFCPNSKGKDDPKHKAVFL